MAKVQTSRQDRFQSYVDRLCQAVGHADRHVPLRSYLCGLLLPGERKSVEPMAARIDPVHASARHQSMNHFVSAAPWDDGAVLDVAREHALAALERHGAVCAWIVDDTGMPKKGSASVGVARQYCGVLGKTENCQVAVSVSLANASLSVPAAYRLYLPQEWAEDLPRREAAGVPASVEFHTKWEIALSQIQQMIQDDLPRGAVLADAGYGEISAFRQSVADLGLSYVVGIQSTTTVWPPGSGPMAPKRWSGVGRPPKTLRRSERHQPMAVAALARKIAAEQWKVVRWREGTKGSMSSRFARLRVRCAHRDYERTQPWPQEWLLIEWPEKDPQPTKYWLSNMAENSTLEEIVWLAHLRWRIERDYQELKSEIGLDHFEGRSWRGFHHHGALCIAAYAFLAAERARLSPPAPLAFLRPAALPEGFRPRGAPPAR